jgi:cytochrome c6
MRLSGIWFLFMVLVSLAIVLGMDSPAARAADTSGEELFKQNCAVCHPDGGNIVNPQKTLHKKDLVANNVKTSGDVVEKMRNPGPGMLKFDSKTISDGDAKKIAEYVLSHFNK